MGRFKWILREGITLLVIIISLSFFSTSILRFFNNNWLYKAKINWSKIKNSFMNNLHLFQEFVDNLKLDTQCRYSFFFLLVKDVFTISQRKNNKSFPFNSYQRSSLRVNFWWNKDCDKANLEMRHTKISNHTRQGPIFYIWNI